MGSRVSEYGKRPIRLTDIERYRRNIQTGQRIRIKVQSIDANYCKRITYRMCTVTEKHKWLLVAEDSKGRLHSATYIDMIMQGGV